ncbi:MAG: class I SAM-dependent methyltransferase [Candidatus Bathyarchaeia archaeon]|jgi:ubiquinone/menaquinone biosynthesis C-methylase UbiE
MALEFRIRDYRHPRQEIVNEVGFKTGFKVLDYGCGPGGYVPAVSQAIGSTGKLYALDALPIAIEMVKKVVAKNGLKNVEAILSDCATGLQNEELDAVLLYDVFHDLSDQDAVLNELHRVLKPNGQLSFSDHHLEENDIISKITGSGLFKLQKKGKYTYSFAKS